MKFAKLFKMAVFIESSMETIQVYKYYFPETSLISKRRRFSKRYQFRFIVWIIQIYKFLFIIDKHSNILAIFFIALDQIITIFLKQNLCFIINNKNGWI